MRVVSSTACPNWSNFVHLISYKTLHELGCITHSHHILFTMANTWTASLDKERPIIGEDIGPVYTIGEVLQKSVERNGSRVQIETAEGEEVTAAAFAERSRQVARALIALGVESRDGVAIIGANSLEWFLSDIGSILAGALPAGVYVTNHTNVVAHILQSAKCSVAIAASEEDLMKILAVRAQCPLLKRVVFWGDDVDLDKFPDHHEVLLSWAEFFAMGDMSHQEELDSRLSAAKPEDCCKMIYTSGTTGMPKAVMISHANICAAVQCTREHIDLEDETNVIVSYLPASHIAANSIDVTVSTFICSAVFCFPTTNKSCNRGRYSQMYELL